MFELGDVSTKIQCPVLTIRILALHMRNMFQAFEGTDAQDKGSIRNFVISLLLTS